MGRRIAAVIFDFEGTLVDFQWRLAEAEAQLRTAFASLGYGTTGNYAQLWNAAADVAGPAGKLATLRRGVGPVYDLWDADAATRWAPRPGAAELLQALAGRGLRTGMVTNIGRAALAGALARFGFKHRLAPVMSRDEVDFLKPRPEGLLRVLAEWKAAPQETLFVGDSRADILAARAAGMRVAIVRNGECAEADLAALSPDHLVSRLDEIVALTGG
ncbi:MAG TPA: HAD family hydrolase [Albitalea sp.]